MENTFNYQTQRLVTLAQNGDQSALDRLCKVYNERVLRLIRMRMGPELRTKMQSMDLVQDAFISAIRSLDNFTYKNEGDFLRWVSKIAENRIRDNFDKIHANKRDVRKETPLNNNSSSTQDTFVGISEPVDNTTPSLIMSKREDLNKLEKAMEKLKPEYREVITLTKMEGLTYKEAAAKMGKAPDAVRMLLSRAITALSQSFEKTE
ncbi:MAG: sigma-70 family RNA polymerase sigma factor [Planctomycetes bacterium]|nr:sigma-70 family RNA polymerase sigma factor [Planctomycetota bacterium]